MEQPATPVAGSNPSYMNSNNPFKASNPTVMEQEQLARQDLRSTDSEKQVVPDISQSTESEKQVVTDRPHFDSANAPMVVDVEETSSPVSRSIRDADKEVVSSWQSKSKEESAPIPMAYHESQSPQSDNLMNDVKGPPPAYNTLAIPTRNGSDDLVTAPSPIEPDGADSTLPPRPEDRSAVGQLLSWMPHAPKSPPVQTTRLLQPVIIPQLDVAPQGEVVPFARCYSDVLAAHGVSMRDFTAFLDGLALAQAPNSALQGLKMLGVGVKSVPLPIIPLAGRGIMALASSGSGNTGSRAKLYIERAKKEYFEPRGLRLSIVKDSDLNPRLEIPSHAYRLAPLTKSTLTNRLCERRLEGVAPYVAPLRYDVPEQDKEVQGVHKLAQKHLGQRFKSDAKALNKLRERQWQVISMSGSSSGNWDERYAAKMSELRRTQASIAQHQSTPIEGQNSTEMKELADALKQDQRELQILVSERQTALQSSRAGLSSTEAEMEEEKWSRRLKWIVIESLK